MDLAERFASQCADIRDKHRFARTQLALARRRRDTRGVRLFHGLIVKCLRALRYAARIKAGRAQPYPDCSGSSQSLFSDAPEKGLRPPTPPVAPKTSRRRTFSERLRRW